MERRSRWTSMTLAVCLCAIMATGGLMTVVKNVGATTTWCPVAYPTEYVVMGNESGSTYVTTAGDYPADGSGYIFCGMMSDEYTIGTAYCIVVSATIAITDDFTGGDRVVGSSAEVYIWNEDKTEIITQQTIMDYRDTNTVWYDRAVCFYDAGDIGDHVYVSIGRWDHWTVDYHLKVAWKYVVVETPANPSWPHAYKGPQTVSLVSGWNLVSLESSTTGTSVYASAMTGHSGGKVNGVEYIEPSGSTHHYGSYYGGGYDFTIPALASFWLHTTGTGTLTLGYVDSSSTTYSMVCPQFLSYGLHQTKAGSWTGYNYWGQMTSYWWNYGMESAPDNLYYPPSGGGSGGHRMASSLGALITGPSYGPFTGYYEIQMWNATAQSWSIYKMGNSSSDYSIDGPGFYYGHHFGVCWYIYGEDYPDDDGLVVWAPS